jgi:hypothetical protein
MKEINNCIIFLIIAGFIQSCQHKEVGDDSEIRYRYFKLENNGWKSRQHLQEVDDINFVATEVPLPYYILKELGTENLFAVDSISKQNQRERVIEFEFAQDEEKDLLKEEFTKLPYKEGVTYLAFSIENDFVVTTTKGDTIKCSGVTFERNFKTAPFHRVLLFFTGIDPKEDIQLIYKDRLFRKGTLKFTFKENPKEIVL